MQGQKPPYAPNVQDQTVDYGGITWKGQPGGDWTPQSKTGGGGLPGQAPTTQDMLNNAKALLDFQKQANQPVINTLGSQTSSIQDRYKSLVDSIKSNQQVSENQQTLTTNNELARRGISGGGLYDQTMTNSLLPVQAAYSGQIANANAGSINDLNTLALQIAQLQAGNPSDALSGALQFGNQQQQASQFAQNYALQQQQLAQQQALQQAQANYYNNMGDYRAAQAARDQYLTVGNKSSLYDLLNGNYISSPTSSSGGGGGGYSGYYGGGW